MRRRTAHERALADRCSHGGHGWEGETCSDIKRTFATRVSDARYRATRPLRSLTGNVRNWRNRRYLETGKGFTVERATRPLRSSVPVYRERINRATGRPRRDDVRVYAVRDREAVIARSRLRANADRHLAACSNPFCAACLATIRENQRRRTR